jgi:capsular exopolysaccharide synthesis family protein
MELRDYVRIVLSHWVGVVVIALLGVLAAVAYNATQPAVYQASATGLVAVGEPPQSGKQLGSSGGTAALDDQLAKSRVTSYASVATSSRVAERVMSDPRFDSSHLPHTASALASDIGVSQRPGTVLLTINARGSSPEKSALLANMWISALGDEIGTLEGTGEPSKMSTAQAEKILGLHLETLDEAASGTQVLPRKNIDLAIGLLVGLLLGFVYAMIRHQFDRRLRSSAEVEKQFGHSVIGMIPQSAQMRQEGGAALSLAVTGSIDSSSASTAEAFRKLRTNLAFMDVDHPPRVIVVTSPKQSDGKSTVAANLAAAIAIGGQPVTLVDGDLRRPTVANSLALVDGAGLTDVLVGRVTSSEVLQDHPEVPGLRVLASGAIPPNPSELLGSKAMQTLVRDLAKEAIVVVDAPPLLPVTDAAVLTRSADGAIVVISYGSTLDTELAVALGNIAAVHGRTLGIVFNRMRRTATSGFYGGDYYRYEYKTVEGRRKLKPRPEKRKRPSKEESGTKA